MKRQESRHCDSLPGKRRQAFEEVANKEFRTAGEFPLVFVSIISNSIAANRNAANFLFRTLGGNIMKRQWLWGILPSILMACQVPTGPEDESLSSQKTHDAEIIEVQLWAGRIKYAAYVGGGEWRATFEVKVMVDSTKNIRDDCEITLFWKSQSAPPTASETGWASFPGMFPHGLASIDGHWLDRLPLRPPLQVYWMRARVMSELFDPVEVIGMCNFLESSERPTMMWNSAVDMEYGLGTRLLAKAKANKRH